MRPSLPSPKHPSTFCCTPPHVLLRHWEAADTRTQWQQQRARLCRVTVAGQAHADRGCVTFFPTGLAGAPVRVPTHQWPARGSSMRARVAVLLKARWAKELHCWHSAAQHCSGAPGGQWRAGVEGGEQSCLSRRWLETRNRPDPGRGSLAARRRARLRLLQSGWHGVTWRRHGGLGWRDAWKSKDRLVALRATDVDVTRGAGESQSSDVAKSSGWGKGRGLGSDSAAGLPEQKKDLPWVGVPSGHEADQGRGRLVGLAWCAAVSGQLSRGACCVQLGRGGKGERRRVGVARTKRFARTAVTWCVPWSIGEGWGRGQRAGPRPAFCLKLSWIFRQLRPSHLPRFLPSGTWAASGTADVVPHCGRWRCAD